MNNPIYGPLTHIATFPAQSQIRYAHPMDAINRENTQSRAGLCATCIHARRITSDRGTEFYMCALSKTDPRFPKYPRLPVISCSGFAPKDSSADPTK